MSSSESKIREVYGFGKGEPAWGFSPSLSFEGLDTLSMEIAEREILFITRQPL